MNAAGDIARKSTVISPNLLVIMPSPDLAADIQASDRDLSSEGLR